MTLEPAVQPEGQEERELQPERQRGVDRRGVAISGVPREPLEPDRVGGKRRDGEEQQIGAEEIAVPNVCHESRGSVGSQVVQVACPSRAHGSASRNELLKVPVRPRTVGVAGVERLVACGDTLTIPPVSWAEPGAVRLRTTEVGSGAARRRSAAAGLWVSPAPERNAVWSDRPGSSYFKK